MESKKLYEIPKRYKYLNSLPLFIRKPLKVIKKKNKSILKGVKRNSYMGNVEKTVILLGVPRSGTSMTGNILHELGVFMSDEDTKGGGEGNEKGFYESGLFANMDDKIIAKAGGLWDTPPSHQKILELKKDKKINSEIKHLVQSQQKKIWGWKGTRTCLTASLYHKYLKNPHYIVVFRNPLSNARSIEKGTKKFWKHKDIYESLKFNLDYSERLIRFLENINSPKLFLSYENMLENPEKGLKAIKDFLKINKRIDINKIIEKKYKHN